MGIRYDFKDKFVGNKEISFIAVDAHVDHKLMQQNDKLNLEADGESELDDHSWTSDIKGSAAEQPMDQLDNKKEIIIY